MKMILAIMPTKLSDQVSSHLIDAEYRLTKMASTASILSSGTTTLMVVANADRVENALSSIREQIPISDPTDTAHARVTIYVLPVKDFERV